MAIFFFSQLQLSTNWHGAEPSKSTAFFPRYPYSHSQASLCYICKASHKFPLAASYWMSQDILSFLPAQRGMCCCTARGKKAFRSLTPGSQHTAPRSHSSCVSGSLSNSQLHCKGTSQPQKSPLISGKKGTGSADGCCELETSHAADPAQICAAQHRQLLEGRAPKILSPSLKFWI